jgi:hypothetical protein
MDVVRNDLGVCPQDDILFPSLTGASPREIFNAVLMSDPWLVPKQCTSICACTLRSAARPTAPPSTRAPLCLKHWRAALVPVRPIAVRLIFCVCLASSEIDELLEEISLAEKKFNQSKTLSGGQKRKLCTAMVWFHSALPCLRCSAAEPSACALLLRLWSARLASFSWTSPPPEYAFRWRVTWSWPNCSQMDPFSRRSFWSFLKKRKEGRVIILTTHLMDEVRSFEQLAGHSSRLPVEPYPNCLCCRL